MLHISLFSYLSSESREFYSVAMLCCNTMPKGVNVDGVWSRRVTMGYIFAESDLYTLCP